MVIQGFISHFNSYLAHYDRHIPLQRHRFSAQNPALASTKTKCAHSRKDHFWVFYSPKLDSVKWYRFLIVLSIHSSNQIKKIYLLFITRFPYTLILHFCPNQDQVRKFQVTTKKISGLSSFFIEFFITAESDHYERYQFTHLSSWIDQLGNTSVK